MKTQTRYENNVVLLWRVDWFHRSGYRAPSQYVEAKKIREAIMLAKDQSRLADFPESWSCHPVEIREIKKSRMKKQEVYS
jgi:hypothetical protein